MFYVKDCPPNMTIDRWLMKQSKMVIPEDKYKNKLTELKLNIDLPALQASAKSAYEKFGWYGFCNIYGTKFERSDVYGGLSLTHNPDYIMPMDDIHAQTLGYPRLNMPEDKFDDMEVWREMIRNRIDKSYFAEINPATKNTYNDTYGFNTPTPAAHHGYIGELTRKFKRSLVRSRLASLNAAKAPDFKRYKEMTWHRDGSWFTEFRLNISVTCLPNTHTLELYDDDGPKTYYKEGHAYLWDTADPHAYWADNNADFDRINLVYAVSPWFDYIEEEKAWVPNGFFMKKHPLDMLMDGDIIDLVL